MAQQQRLPDGLADLPPGPELAALLADIDPARLNGHNLVQLAPVFAKMIAHYQAGLATVLNQVEYCPPGDSGSPVERTEQPHGWAAIEVAAKLRWTAGKASYELRHAYHLTRRLPAVHAALAAGVIDFPRERLADRFVQSEPHPDGTANLVGVNLPPDRVAGIMERLTAIARTAKRQGDSRTVRQLQADSFVDLLAGTGIGATPPGPVTPADRSGSSTPVRPHESGKTAAGAIATTGTSLRPGADPGPDPTGVTERGVPAEAAAGTLVEMPTGVSAPLPGPRRGVVELTAPLSALIGWSQAPGTIAGWGPVIADICRQIIAKDPAAQWRFSIYDDLFSGGQLAYHGITQARPGPPESGGGRNGFSTTDAAFLRARDRTCRGPHGCDRPASRCELDHTIAKVDGGGHERGNGGPLCTREHHVKHESGASLRQPEPGVFEWTTPLGHAYTVTPEPYDESTGPPRPEPSDGGPAPPDSADP